MACSGVALAAAPLPVPASENARQSLHVWSCAGLAEAMRPAHVQFSKESGIDVAYTGAFAGALGKSLFMGKRTTDVFAGRVLALTKNLRKAQKMLYFKSLCFTSYVIGTPKGNPAGIHELKDLGRSGVRVAMAPLSSPPGSQSVMGILKKCGLTEAVMKNVLVKRASCIQRTITEVTQGNAHAMIVERRLTVDPRYAEHLEIVEIPEEFFPEGPLTFTVGVMQTLKDKALADRYVDWITGPGQKFFAIAGFIPANCPKSCPMGSKDHEPYSLDPRVQYAFVQT